MIEPKEINKIAATNRVSDKQIEKDYVLSWVLFAISKNGILNKALVFKGAKNSAPIIKKKVIKAAKDFFTILPFLQYYLINSTY